MAVETENPQPIKAEGRSSQQLGLLSADPTTFRRNLTVDKNTIIPDEIKVHSLSNEDWIALLFNKLPEGCVPVATGSVYHPAQAPAGMVGKIMLGNLVSMEAK